MTKFSQPKNSTPSATGLVAERVTVWIEGRECGYPLPRVQRLTPSATGLVAERVTVWIEAGVLRSTTAGPKAHAFGYKIVQMKKPCVTEE